MGIGDSAMNLIDADKILEWLEFQINAIDLKLSPKEYYYGATWAFEKVQGTIEDMKERQERIKKNDTN